MATETTKWWSVLARDLPLIDDKTAEKLIRMEFQLLDKLIKANLTTHFIKFRDADALLSRIWGKSIQSVNGFTGIRAIIIINEYLARVKGWSDTFELLEDVDANCEERYLRLVNHDKVTEVNGIHIMSPVIVCKMIIYFIDRFVRCCGLSRISEDYEHYESFKYYEDATNWERDSVLAFFARNTRGEYDSIQDGAQLVSDEGGYGEYSHGTVTEMLAIRESYKLAYIACNQQQSITYDNDLKAYNRAVQAQIEEGHRKAGPNCEAEFRVSDGTV